MDHSVEENVKKVGGGCSYKNESGSFTVLAVDDQFVQFNIGDYKGAKVEIKRFDPKPSVGDEYTLEVDTIISGSCTPLMVKKITAKK